MRKKSITVLMFFTMALSMVGCQRGTSADTPVNYKSTARSGNSGRGRNVVGCRCEYVPSAWAEVGIICDEKEGLAFACPSTFADDSNLLFYIYYAMLNLLK